MDSCALINTGQGGSCHSLAHGALQALRSGLHQAHWQRCSTVLYLSPPCSAVQSSRQSGSDLPASGQPSAASTAPSRPPPRRQQAGSVAPISRVGQHMAAPQTAGHHTALGSILHSSVAAGPSYDPGAHGSEGLSSSQRPDAPRLAPGWVRHQAQGRGAPPLAQGEAALHGLGAVSAALVPWRRPVQPARGRGGAPNIRWTSAHPVPLPA